MIQALSLFIYVDTGLALYELCNFVDAFLACKICLRLLGHNVKDTLVIIEKL